MELLMDTNRDEIRSLIHRYCFHFDQNEPEAVAALFTEDATIDYGPEHAPIVGRGAIAPTIAVGLSERFAATSHHVSNIEITFAGETTRDRSRTSTRGTNTSTAPRASSGSIHPPIPSRRRAVADRRVVPPGGGHQELPSLADASDRPSRLRAWAGAMVPRLTAGLGTRFRCSPCRRCGR